jgi:DNA-binding PadR family transcriptional regulator
MALSHAILATLADRPCSGYDLAKKFDGSVGFFWRASHQQIYRELSKLEEHSYIAATIVRQENRPDKKVYEVTGSGCEYLKTWIACPTEVHALKDELLVKLFAGKLVAPQIILTELEHHRAQHQDSLNGYLAIERQFFTDVEHLDINQRYQYLTLRQGIRLETEWLEWCDEAVSSISTQIE